MKLTVEQFWQEFLAATGRDGGTQCYEAFHFDLSEKVANELLALVLSGQKRATAGSLLGYQIDGGDMPQVGDFSIVTDWDGAPRCVIQTTAVTVLPFNEMTFDICKREGEDECLETWVESHRRFFEEEGAAMGYVFTEDMPVVFEDFEVVYRT